MEAPLVRTSSISFVSAPIFQIEGAVACQHLVRKPNPLGFQHERSSEGSSGWRRIGSKGVRSVLRATPAGSNGSGAWSEKAVTRVFPLALGNTSTVTTAPLS